MLRVIKGLLFLILKHLGNRTRLWYARLVGVQVGKDCRLYSVGFGAEPYLVSIGDHVTVSGDVMFITHDGGVWVLRHLDATADYVRPIVVEDNVFIGARAIVLPGVVIGSNSVVAAGSVVTKHVPQGVVVAGVPAQVISTTKEYARKLDSCVQTKGLSAREKKRKLLEIWGWMPNQRKERLLAVGACETTEQPL